jgi:hypothetical protein
VVGRIDEVDVNRVHVGQAALEAGEVVVVSPSDIGRVSEPNPAR